MNDDQPTGGPAFPTCFASPNDFADGARLPLGMTLRDYFAAQAIGPLSATPFYQRSTGNSGTHDYKNELAAEAYGLADAMLRARGTA